VCSPSAIPDRWESFRQLQQGPLDAWRVPAGNDERGLFAESSRNDPDRAFTWRQAHIKLGGEGMVADENQCRLFLTVLDFFRELRDRDRNAGALHSEASGEVHDTAITCRGADHRVDAIGDQF
jgi:hypothetical protein